VIRFGVHFRARHVPCVDAAPDPEAVTEWSKPWHVLLWTFAAAVAYSLAASALPALASFPVFDWVGLPAITAWGWELSPALGYIGQVGPGWQWMLVPGAVGNQQLFDDAAGMILRPVHREVKRIITVSLQGMIMGPKTAVSMLIGAILGELPVHHP
jgi:hypothetical protein